MIFLLIFFHKNNLRIWVKKNIFYLKDNQLNAKQLKHNYFNTDNPMKKNKFKSSILNTDLAINRRSFTNTNVTKKVVRFADALGLELESIITLSQMDETNRRLKLKHNSLRNSTKANYQNYVNIDYHTNPSQTKQNDNISYGEFARDLYQKRDQLTNTNQYQQQQQHHQLNQNNFYLNDTMNKITFSGLDSNPVTINTHVPNNNNTNNNGNGGSVSRQNKSNENISSLNYINKQNQYFSNRFGEDLNPLKYSPINQNLSSNGNSDRDETSSSNSSDVLVEKNLSTQLATQMFISEQVNHTPIFKNKIYTKFKCFLV
jgi:hypothetical protein